MAPVEFRKVSKSYGPDEQAVADLDLAIDDGEFVVLVGPSGSGKSTILRMVAGLEDISSGEIAIGGRIVNGLSPGDRDVAMVFQNYALYPHMTARENLSFAARLRKLPANETAQRVAQTAEMLGIGALLDRMPASLSGGEQQRVALGRAIMRQPLVFLFDEPLSSIDVHLRVDMRSEIRQLQRRLGTTSIYVTHDSEEAMTMADRIVVLSRGRVQQIDTPLAVYESPANRFVASFVGAPTMNFLDGRIECVDEGVEFVETSAAGQDAVLSLSIPPTAVQTLNGKIASGFVVLGIRPHAFGLCEPNSETKNSIEMKTVAAEPLGDWVDVHGTTPGGQRLTARLRSAPSFSIGDRISLHVDAEQTHLFESGEFGRNLKCI